MVNQREWQDSLSFANALRAALREDPDVILVGEMRDLETISTAITAAETGHLVMSTLHTTSAAQTVDRIIDVFPPYQQTQIRVQLAGVIQGFIAQQLLIAADEKDRVVVRDLAGTDAVRNTIREGKSHQIQSYIQTGQNGHDVHGLFLGPTGPPVGSVGDCLPLLSGYRHIAAVSDQRLDHVLTPDSTIRI